MADHQIGNQAGLPVVDGNNRTGAIDNDNLDSIDAMRTRLAAIDAGLYTDDYLNGMTYNDMVYAIRLNDNATTIKQ